MSDPSDFPPADSLLEALFSGPPFRNELKTWLTKAGDRASASLQALGRLYDADGAANLAADVRDLASWIDGCDDAELALAIALAATLHPHDGVDYSPIGKQLSVLAPQVDDQGLEGLGLLARAELTRSSLAIDDYAQLCERGISLLPPGSGLAHHRLRMLALRLGMQGMLGRLNSALELGKQGPLPPEGLRLACFYDAVQCGRLGESARLLESLQDSPEIAAHADVFASFQELMSFWESVAAGGPVAKPAAPYLEVFRSLLSRDSEVLAALAEESDPSEIVGSSTIFSLMPVRIALSMLDVSVARNLLERRRECQAQHYLDHLFWSRLYFLEGRRQEARQSFADAWHLAQSYGALERFDWELRLAAELRPSDLVDLSQGDLKPKVALGWELDATIMAAEALEQEAQRSAGPGDYLGSSSAALDLRAWIRGDLLKAGPVTLVGPAGSGRQWVVALEHQHHRAGRLRHFYVDAQSDSELAGLLADFYEKNDRTSTAVLVGYEAMGPLCQALLMSLLRVSPLGNYPRVVCIGEVLPGSTQLRSELVMELTAGCLACPPLSERPVDACQQLAWGLAQLQPPLVLDSTASEWLADNDLSGNGHLLAGLVIWLGRYASSSVIIDRALLQLAYEAIARNQGVGS